MKTLNLLLSFFILTTIFICTSCKKDNKTSSTVTSQTSIVKKWLVTPTTTKATYTLSDFVSFEFMADSSYIIQTKDSCYTGKYSMSTDNKTVTFNNFGVLTINSLSDSQFAFNLKPTNGSTIVITTSAIAVISASLKTTLLCKSWNLTMLSGPDTMLIYPTSIIKKAGIIFTKYGTAIFPIYQQDGNNSIDNMNWIWNDINETSIKVYGDTVINPKDKVIYYITTLTASNLTFNDGKTNLLNTCYFVQSNDILKSNFYTKSLSNNTKFSALIKK